MGIRREGRELTLKMLYALDVNPAGLNDVLQQFRETVRADGAARVFAEDLVAGVVANRSAIDGMIGDKSKNWAIARMARVDISILRMAVYELLFRADIPRNVTINEAIEVAKKFGTEDSPAFVNGILDEIASSLPHKE